MTEKQSGRGLSVRARRSLRIGDRGMTLRVCGPRKGMERRSSPSSSTFTPSSVPIADSGGRGASGTDGPLAKAIRCVGRPLDNSQQRWTTTVDNGLLGIL